jgi:hypothetical protein
MKYKDFILIPNDYAIIGVYQLQSVTSNCELCNKPMKTHLWVILNNEGVASFMCSNKGPQF